LSGFGAFGSSQAWPREPFPAHGRLRAGTESYRDREAWTSRNRQLPWSTCQRAAASGKSSPPGSRAWIRKQCPVATSR